jgi:hypothetical protein
MKKMMVALVVTLMAVVGGVVVAESAQAVSGTFNREEWGTADVGDTKQRIENVCNCGGWQYYTDGADVRWFAYWKNNDVGQNAVIVKYRRNDAGNWITRGGFDQEGDWPDLT